MRRYSVADLPETVPVFPLPGALLLPRGRLPLNIFEPRYLAMLDDVLRSDHRMIGMIQPSDEARPPRLQKIGCAGRVTSLSETEDGRYLIVLSGICRFRVMGEVDGFTPYRRLRVDFSSFSDDLKETEIPPRFDKTGFLKLLKRYFDLAQLSSDWDTMREAEVEMLVNSLSMMCPFKVEEKQALLESPTLADRAETLEALIRFAIAESSGGSALQ